METSAVRAKIKIENQMEEFNLFKNLYVTEAGHTSLLKRLLHPNGTHGYGDTFLKLFLNKIKVSCDNPSVWKLSTEEESGERGFIDLLINSGDQEFVVVIENKVKGARDQPFQLYRYWRNGIYEVLKNKNKYTHEDLVSISMANKVGITNRCKLVYLTKKAGVKPSDDSLKRPFASSGKYDGFPDKLPYPVTSISYKKEIKEWLHECLAKIDRDQSPRLYSSLEQYIEFIEKYMF